MFLKLSFQQKITNPIVAARLKSPALDFCTFDLLTGLNISMTEFDLEELSEAVETEVGNGAARGS